MHIRPAERGVVQGGSGGVASADRMTDLSSVGDSNFCICASPFNSKCFFTRSHSLLQTPGGGEEGHRGCLVPIGLQGVWHQEFAIGAGFTPLL